MTIKKQEAVNAAIGRLLLLLLRLRSRCAVSLIVDDTDSRRAVIPESEQISEHAAKAALKSRLQMLQTTC